MKETESKLIEQGKKISEELEEIDIYLPNLATDGLFEVYKNNKK